MGEWGGSPPFQRTKGDSRLNLIIDAVSNEPAIASPGGSSKLKSCRKINISIQALLVFLTPTLPPKSLFLAQMLSPASVTRTLGPRCPIYFHVQLCGVWRTLGSSKSHLWVSPRSIDVRTGLTCCCPPWVQLMGCRGCCPHSAARCHG